MKKVLVLSMILLSFVSYAQEEKYKLKKIKTISYVKEYIDAAPKYNKSYFYKSISLGTSAYGNVYYEMRGKQKENGFGIDVYRDKVIYPDNFWNKYYNETDKFILSSNKRLGIGIYYITPLKYGFDLSAGVGGLHFYMPSSLLTISNNIAVKPTTTWYWIFSFTKNVRITERFYLEGRGIFRNIDKYSIILNNSRVTKFEPALGIRYDISFKKG
jgi:hypothetical protein